MKSVKCPECGFVGWADSERCKKCGVARLPDLTSDQQQPPPTYLENRGFEPQYSAGPDPRYSAGTDPRYSDRQLKKGLAITALVIGILDLFTLGLLGIGAIAGVVVAIVALSNAKRKPYEYGGQSLATAGLVMSIVSVVMAVPIGIVAAIAIPNLLASRRAANEGSSIAALRTLHSAEQTYQATYGNGSYGTLSQLRQQGLIHSDLADGMRHGYKFTVEIKEWGSDGPAGFQVVGVPLDYGSTGRRSFFVDETGVIRAADNFGAKATELDEPLNSSGYSSSSPPSRSSSYDSRDY